MKQPHSPIHCAADSLPTEVASDELDPARAAARADASPRPGGWDPFEVWRTRVRDARRDADPATDV